jgi:hypothetical protein
MRDAREPLRGKAQSTIAPATEAVRTTPPPPLRKARVVGDGVAATAIAPEPPRPFRGAWLRWRARTRRGWVGIALAMLVLISGAVTEIDNCIAAQEEQAAAFRVMQANLSQQPRAQQLGPEGTDRERLDGFAGAAERDMAGATQSDPIALGRLGWFSENGPGGLPRNPSLALQRYQRAAQLGDTQAEQRLMQLGQRW